MTQQEFEQRVGMSVNATEYASIENVYMASDLDKDAFCILWEKMKLQKSCKSERRANNQVEGANEEGTAIRHIEQAIRQKRVWYASR